MKAIFRISLLLWLAVSVTTRVQAASKVLQSFDWKDISAQMPDSEIVTMDGMPVLKIAKTNDASAEVSLITITNSAVIHRSSAVEWEMKYENVSSSSSRELYAIYPPQAVGGDAITNQYGIQCRAGTRNWDKFSFTIMRAPYDNETPPDKLELKLYVPSNSTFYLRPVKLVGWVDNSAGWWTSQQAGLIGAIGGSLIGCLGAMTGILGSKGRARGLVLTTVKICIVIGIVMLIGGVTAIALKQPYAVYYPMLLGGFILTIVFSVNLPAIQRRYDELEIRRMASEDAMRG